MLSRLTLAALLTMALYTTPSHAAEQKIGHANLELVLLYMPETALMQKTLDGYRDQLAEQLEIKQRYAQGRLEGYTKKRSSGMTEAEEQAAIAELTKLESEIQKLAADSDAKLLSKRQELTAPILQKVEKALQAEAKAGGFTYVFNTVSGDGVSAILYGPDENDLTAKILTRLGVEVPK